MDSQENMLSTNNSQTGNNDVQKENKSNFCSNCKTVLDDEQKFCPMCGTDQSNTKKIVCSSCGFELLSGQIFCPRCGARICDDFICDTNEIKNKSKFSAFKGKTKGKKVVIIVCFIILIALIAVIVVFNVKNRGVELDFEKLYDGFNYRLTINSKIIRVISHWMIIKLYWDFN